MDVLKVTDVNEALPLALNHLHHTGRIEDTRNGPAVVAPCPVATVYREPRQRVLFDKVRDANPFFHLFESLWILAGQDDVKFLSWFNSRIAQYSDDGDTFHAPYGFRLRHHFGFDQIGAACAALRRDPNTRRAVMQIWDAGSDLETSSLDIPCNDMVFLRVRNDSGTLHRSQKVLDLTVANRSNDAIWGAYGANAVQFSMLQEYMAAHLRVGVGVYTQVSHNLHAYTDNPYWKFRSNMGHSAMCLDNAYWYPQCAEITPLVDDGEDISDFDNDLRMFFEIAQAYDNLDEFSETINLVHSKFVTLFFRDIVHTMLMVYTYREAYYRELYDGRLDWTIVETLTEDPFDWFVAGRQWLNARKAKRAKTENKE